MKKIGISLFIGLMLLSCRQDIVDFFEAIQDYGYRSLQPLSLKKLPVNENITGGYVYQGLPVIISKKDANTYQIKFLTVLLHKEDAVIDAFTTEVGGLTFFNLAMGDYYCFMQANLIMNQQLEVKLLKDVFREYVKPADLKIWFEKNPGAETFLVKNEDGDYQLDIYFEFAFEKITVSEALTIQKNRLLEAKKELFQYCESYMQYEDLMKQYPNDEFQPLAIQSLLKNCTTIEEVLVFKKYFSGKPEYIVLADEKIAVIKENQILAANLKTDQKDYSQMLKYNSLDSFIVFQQKCLTEAYRDSSSQKIAAMAAIITKDEIAWKWTNGERDKAMDYLFLKIDYLKNSSDASWIIPLISEYALLEQSVLTREKVLLYFDYLVEKHVSHDDFLNLCIQRGFILWSMSKIDLALQSFELKLDTEFVSGQTVREKIKVDYDFYKSLGIVFPDEKNTLKRIKKLKSDY